MTITKTKKCLLKELNEEYLKTKNKSIGDKIIKLVEKEFKFDRTDNFFIKFFVVLLTMIISIMWISSLNFTNSQEISKLIGLVIGIIEWTLLNKYYSNFKIYKEIKEEQEINELLESKEKQKQELIEKYSINENCQEN